MDVDNFIARMLRSGKNFYHFTDLRNLPSIRQNGYLRSRKELASKRIQIAAPGGNELSQQLDDACGMDGYVHCSLKTSHPMEEIARREGRVDRVIYLAVNPKILKAPGVKFTDGVSNKKGVNILSVEEAITKIDWEVLHTFMQWRDPAINARLKIAEKCELIVPEKIPNELISGL